VTHVGLVLGAGGLAGHAFHAGVLRALVEVTGWDARTADLVVGTSAGSMVAANLRAGVPPGDLHRRLTGQEASAEGMAILSRLPAPRVPDRPTLGWPPRPQSPGMLGARALRPWTLRPGHLLASLAPEGTTSTAMLTERIRRLHPGRWPDEPTWICAVRLRDGARVVFGRDPTPQTDLGTAAACSSAIPGWFEPVEVDGERYVDGAVHSPTNAELLVGLGLDVAIVSSPMSSTQPRSFRAPPNPARMLHTAMLERELKALRDSGMAVLVFQPTREVLEVMGLNAMDPRRMGDVAERSYAEARRVAGASDLTLA
jgi:NTE family protein